MKVDICFVFFRLLSLIFDLSFQFFAHPFLLLPARLPARCGHFSLHFGSSDVVHVQEETVV